MSKKMCLPSAKYANEMNQYQVLIDYLETLWRLNLNPAQVHASLPSQTNKHVFFSLRERCGKKTVYGLILFAHQIP
jgi:hypothetical protein